jgi:hypothetical protein
MPRSQRIKPVLKAINLPMHVLNLVVGKNHPLWARLCLGLIIMIGSAFIEPHPTFLDAVKGAVHAIGMVPFLDALIDLENKEA